jgi:hypothetical protein
MEIRWGRQPGLAIVHPDQTIDPGLRAVADDGDAVGGQGERKGIANGRRRPGKRADGLELQLQEPDGYGRPPRQF